MKYLGITKQVSNASGGVNPNYKVGDIVYMIILILLQSTHYVVKTMSVLSAVCTRSAPILENDN
jgi:hypothetical protein